MNDEKKEIQYTKFTPERLVRMLKGNETEMSTEEATMLLSFLKKLSQMIVAKYLNNENKSDTNS